MARQSVGFFSLNRGECSLLALQRVDIEHLRLAAQSQINWLPRVLGPMMLRPGTEFIGETQGDLPTKLVPYVAAFNDTALIELTQNNMRIWRNDALVTRNYVSTVIADFPSWTSFQSGTAVVQKGVGTLKFSTMNSNATANAYVAVAVQQPYQNVEHALRFTVSNGPVTFSIGTAPGLGDIFGVQTLDTGLYSMAFTPNNATVYVTFSAVRLTHNSNTTSQSIPTWNQLVQVSNISVEGAGVLTLPTPWAASEIGTPQVTPSTLRYDQSANVVFFAAAGVPQYQINRYSPTSWSIVNYRPVKGPMAAVPSNSSINLTVAQYYGNTTLTASGNLFTPADVGTLFRLFSSGQIVSETLSFSNTYTDSIRVTGVSYVSTIDSGSVVNTATTDRNFSITTTGTWTGTLRLQRSFTSASTGFSDFAAYTTNQSGVTITDGLNNEIVWYRLGFDPGDLSSGSVLATLSYTGGGNYGVCHVLSYASPTVVNVEVLVPFWSLAGTSDWLQSEWSSSQGYPTCVALHEGRLWWAGADKWWGSVSDDYSNFDYDATGDAAPIDQSIGSGPIANINWLVSIDHLLAGADTSIITAMSDAIESPLTPTNFTLRRSVTNGSYQISGIPVDQRVVYIDQSGRKIYELIYDIRLYNYKPSDLTRLNPDIGIQGFTAMAVQRQPDTRINLIRKDGVLVSFIYDSDDDVQAFWRVTTKGEFEDVAVLPGSREDAVYVVVRRLVGGVQRRFIERFSRIDECQGAALTKCVDSHLVYQGAPAAILSGFDHLIGLTVAIWGQTLEVAGGDFDDDYSSLDYDTYADIPSVTGDLGTAVVDASGNVAIPNGSKVITAVIGIPFQAEFISAKLEYAAKMGSAINQVKRLDHVGFSLVNTHCQGVRFGSWIPGDPTNINDGLFNPPQYLDDMPLIEDAAEVPANYIWSQYDNNQIEFPSDFSTDNRIYLQARSPRPATVLGITFTIEASG